MALPKSYGIAKGWPVGPGQVNPVVTLNALTLGTITLTSVMDPGDVVCAVSGKTTGSTLAMTGIAFSSGKLALSGSNVIVGLSGPLTAADTTGTFTITETLGGATNSPLANNFSSITVSAGSAAPTNVSLPVITGTVAQGSTLSASNGTWTDSPSSYTYQWQADGVDFGSDAATQLLDNAQVGKVITIIVTAINGSGSTSATSAATSAVQLVTLPTTPVFRMSAALSPNTNDGTRILTIDDLIGTAHAVVTTDVVGADGPKLMTDADGRKFLRFESQQGLKMANALSYNAQVMSVFMVGKVHRAGSSQLLFTITGNTTSAWLSARLNVGDSPVSAMTPRTGGKLPTVQYPYAQMGAQLQVLGGVARTTANGAIRNYVNNNVGLAAQATSVTSSAATGIGYYINTPPALGSMGEFDLYEIVTYNSSLTNAAADAIAAALVSAYAIQDVKHQVICEGDSITYGWPAAISGSGNCVSSKLAPKLTNKNIKVVDFGTSGNLLSQINARATTVDTATLLPNTSGARNIFILQGGVNDTTARSKAQIYADLVTTITGLLALNSASYTVEVVSVVCIGVANAAKYPKFEDAVDGLYAKMRATSTFLTDCSANVGDTYDGKLSVLDLAAYTGPGSAIFADHTAATNTTYYYTDGIHPNELGTEWMAQAYADHINAMGLS